MGVRVLVSEHVVLSRSVVFAETASHVFRSAPQAPRQLFNLGNRVRQTREIELAQWECFSKCSDLPTEYLEAI